MNLYLRFFTEEVLVETPEQAIDFLMRLPDVRVDDALCHELISYAQSANSRPKRFKLSAKVYFIVIKTSAKTMEEFKEYNKEIQLAATAAAAANAAATGEHPLVAKEQQVNDYAKEMPGWYRAQIMFKRIVTIPATRKCCYMDTQFEVRLKARSVQDCYNRVVDHLRNRADVDPRSQFPSIRGRDFKAEYLGME